MADVRVARRGLLPVQQAIDTIVADARRRVVAEQVDVAQADSRILLADIRASTDVPPWDNSAMDGYAVQAQDAGEGVVLKVSQRVPAGLAPEPLQPGTAARIFTGAPLPEGADAVVMQENCERLPEQSSDSHASLNAAPNATPAATPPALGSVRILQAVRVGENVRRRGNDISRDTLLLPAGHRLAPLDLGVLAATGISHVTAGRRPVVAVFSTGDELVTPGTPLRSGQIFNSNAPVMKALLQRMGLQVLELGNVADRRDATVQALKAAATQADCIISTGGVSAGEEDHVRAAVQEHGELAIWKLALKPGKPFAYGRMDTAMFFGLPGNPVSAVVSFVLLVRPALLAMMGAANVTPAWQWCEAGFERPLSGEREEYLRVCVEAASPTRPTPRITPLANQSSGAGSSLSRADGLAVIAPHTAVGQGDLLRFLAFDDIF